MRLVPFTAILPDGAYHPVRVNPESVLGLSPPLGPNGPMLDRCEIRAPDGPMVVVGSVDEVAAALLGAVAPVEPVVEPDDLDAAAAIIDLLAEASESDDVDVWACVGVGMVDDALGLVNGDFEDTSRHLRALAARLRGGTR